MNISSILCRISWWSFISWKFLCVCLFLCAFMFFCVLLHFPLVPFFNLASYFFLFGFCTWAAYCAYCWFSDFPPFLHYRTRLGQHTYDLLCVLDGLSFPFFFYIIIGVIMYFNNRWVCVYIHICMHTYTYAHVWLHAHHTYTHTPFPLPLEAWNFSYNWNAHLESLFRFLNVYMLITCKSILRVVLLKIECDIWIH